LLGILKAFLTSINWRLEYEYSQPSFGAIGALVNFAVAFLVMSRTNKVPKEVEKMVENIRIPAAN
jgi:cation/acetate symporter